MPNPRTIMKMLTRYRNPLTVALNNVLQHKSTVTISKAPPAKSSGLVQLILSTVSPHSG
jgi:hypothetical protein